METTEKVTPVAKLTKKQDKFVFIFVTFDYITKINDEEKEKFIKAVEMFYEGSRILIHHNKPFDQTILNEVKKWFKGEKDIRDLAYKDMPDFTDGIGFILSMALNKSRTCRRGITLPGVLIPTDLYPEGIERIFTRLEFFTY